MTLHYHSIHRARAFKCLMMFLGIALMVYAHQTDAVYYENGSNNYDRAVSIFCLIWTGLVLIEYWKFTMLRLIAGVAFLGVLNMVTDEFFFRPDIAGINEYISGVVIVVTTIYNIIKAIADGSTDTP